MTCTLLLLPLLLGLYAHAAAFADPNPTPPVDNGSQRSLKYRQVEVERWQYNHGQLGLHTLPTNGQGYLNACMSDQASVEEGSTHGLERILHPSLIRSAQAFQSTPSGPRDVAILYSGDVRSFVNPNVRNDTATAVVQPLLEAGYNVHAFFALKKRFHFSCESPLGKATPGCNAGSSRLFDPQYYDDKVSETDVQGVVDSLYPHNTVTWLHPNCCAQYQRVAEPQVGQFGVEVVSPEDCPFCKHTATCASLELFSQWYTVQRAHLMMEAHELQRGRLFSYVLRLRPDCVPNHNAAHSILHPVTGRLHAESDVRICHDEDRAAMMRRWQSSVYFSSFRNFEHCAMQQQPLVDQVCTIHGNFTSVSGKRGVSFSKHRCACDFRMHGHRFGLVYSTSKACTASFRWWMDRTEPLLPITSSENSVVRPRPPLGS